MKIECCICLEDFTSANEGKIVTTKCGHLFHEECLNSWLNNDVTCPQCRKTVTRSELHNVYLTASSNRRSSIFNSTLCQGYREVQDNLVLEQQKNKEEMENLKAEVEKLKLENRNILQQGDVEKENLKAEVAKLKKQNFKLLQQKSIDETKHLKAENEKLQKKLAELQASHSHGHGTVLQRQTSNGRYVNVESVVAKAWKRNGI